MTLDPSSLPRSFHLRLAVGISSFVLVLLFHHLLAKFPYGFSFTLFVLGLIVAIHIVLIATSTLTNRWAYLFLLPALLAAVSESLYAGIAIRLLAPPISAISLAFFAFWASATPQQLLALPTLWPKAFAFDTFLPFSHYRSFFHRSDNASSKQVSQIAFGIFISLPILLVFIALFRSADAYFDASITQWLEFDNLGERLGRYLLDVIVGCFFLGFLWTSVVRIIHPHSILFRPISPSLKEHLALNTLLGLVNGLFLLFVTFQLIYLFQGQGYLESHGVTYASYARQGFFELLAVAALVFLLTWIVYRLTNMRNLGARVLNAVLVGQTAIIIISALKRLWMYVEAYGFTVSRWWGIAGAILVGILLTMCFIGIIRKIHIASLMKWMAFVSLFFVSLCLLPNSEAFVARTNTQRFLAGKMRELDYGYLSQLSSDALGVLTDFSSRPWPSEEISSITSPNHSSNICYQPETNTYLADRSCLKKLLHRRYEELLEQTNKDWRPGTLTDYRALNALAQIK